MKIIEIPVNTLVELQFYYMGERHKVGVGLIYKSSKSVYVSAIKNAGKTVPATLLYNVHLLYRTDLGIYIFKKVALRSISFNGQKLYVVQTEQEAFVVDLRKDYRLYIGANIAARLIKGEEREIFHCILRDISMKGMGILSSVPVDQTAQIEITFRVNKNNKETLVSNIVRVNEFKNGSGYLYGCEFIEPNDTISKYVAKQLEKKGNHNEV